MNFDEIIDRSGRGAIKTGRNKQLFGTEDVLAMWVADMEFRSPQCVKDAILETLDYGVLGYHEPKPDFYDAVIKWQSEQHQMLVKKEWITYIPGVVTAIAVAINAFTQEGDSIVVQTPVYFPFFEYPRRNKRKVLRNPLIEKEGTYVMDYDNLEQHFKDGAKLMILCSPHNPLGRIWQQEELAKIAVLAEKYGVIVVSDEIHSDLALDDSLVTSYATISEEASMHSVTLIAPSKTFNIAGLAASVAITKNDKLRRLFVKQEEKYELHSANFLGPVAMAAAFNEGKEWRKQMLDYLTGNIDFAMDYFQKYIPQIKPWRPEASFLLWLDCREMTLSDKDLLAFFVKKAKLGISPGVMFGKEGAGFMRMNFAVPRPTLEKALEQLKNAFL